MTKERRNRLRAIRSAVQDIESALLTLREARNPSWLNACFGSLYYLNRLARKAK